MPESIIQTSRQQFQKSIEHLKEEYKTISAGRAHPSLIENITFEAYGAPTQLKNIAQISVTSSTQLSVQAWDKSLITAIEKAIREAPLGLQPSYDSINQVIRINFPSLTEERRRDITKICQKKAEECRVAMRQIRHDIQHEIRNMKEVSKDLIEQLEKELDAELKKSNTLVDEILKHKEDDIMKI